MPPSLPFSARLHTGIMNLKGNVTALQQRLIILRLYSDIFIYLCRSAKVKSSARFSQAQLTSSGSL